MAHRISSYDGGVIAYPEQLIHVRDVTHLQEILRDRDTYPSPVRAVGSFHSLTPCVSTDGTMIDMKGMARVLKIDSGAKTVTAEAGAELINVARELAEQGLQFRLNVEIGNITLGSAACCHTKDGLDGIEFGQLSSYVKAIKWVDAAGELQSASEEGKPELLRLVRSSYGLCGIIYEVTFVIEPIKRIHFTYKLIRSKALTQEKLDEIIESNGSIVCWTVGYTTVIQTRNDIGAGNWRRSWLAAARRRTWNLVGALVARGIQRYIPTPLFKTLTQNIWFVILRGIYRSLSWLGGMKLNAPEKTVDYSKTRPSARYAFTYWTFPREHWVANLQAYLEFAADHYRRTGFRCNMLLGSYFIRHDTSSILSYTYDGDTFSIDPIHAVSEGDGWEDFLGAFNDWAFERGGIPLFNQSPFITKPMVQQAFGKRWSTFSKRVRSVDPDGRLLNAYFEEILE